MASWIELIFNVFVIGFLIILLLAISKAINEHKNSKFPTLTVEAKIISKNVRRVTRNFDDYYITFELSSEERLEFEVTSSEYGLFLEGDYGKLTYQGTIFRSFERIAH